MALPINYLAYFFINFDKRQLKFKQKKLEK